LLCFSVYVKDWVTEACTSTGICWFERPEKAAVDEKEKKSDENCGRKSGKTY